MKQDFLYVSWETYHNHAQKLAETLLSGKNNYEEIVAISRGGLTLGHMLSDFLRIPISVISIQSYTDIKTQGEIKITGKPQTPLVDKDILIVDDVADSGKTLKRAVSYLKEYKPTRITTAVMYYKPRSVVQPDYYSDQTDKWVLFPYEPTEMLLLLINKLQKQGKNKEIIRKKLTLLGFKPNQINFVYTYYL